MVKKYICILIFTLVCKHLAHAALIFGAAHQLDRIAVLCLDHAMFSESSLKKELDELLKDVHSHYNRKVQELYPIYERSRPEVQRLIVAQLEKRKLRIEIIHHAREQKRLNKKDRFDLEHQLFYKKVNHDSEASLYSAHALFERVLLKTPRGQRAQLVDTALTLNPNLRPFSQTILAQLEDTPLASAPAFAEIEHEPRPL